MSIEDIYPNKIAILTIGNDDDYQDQLFFSRPMYRNEFRDDLFKIKIHTLKPFGRITHVNCKQEPESLEDFWELLELYDVLYIRLERRSDHIKKMISYVIEKHPSTERPFIIIAKLEHPSYTPRTKGRGVIKYYCQDGRSKEFLLCSPDDAQLLEAAITNRDLFLNFDEYLKDKERLLNKQNKAAEEGRKKYRQLASKKNSK